MEADDPQHRMQALLARSWIDADFRRELMADPRAVLEGQGAQLPPEVEIRVVEESERVIYLVLPTRPTHLSDLELDKICAGASDALLGHLPPWLMQALTG